MKFLGHPIHIILVHFPSALFPLSVFLSYLARIYEIEQFTITAVYMLIAGVVMGWLAGITGLIDLVVVAENKPHSLKKALWHGGINIVVLLIFTVFAFMHYKKLPTVEIDNNFKLIIKTIAVVTLMIGNFLGAELILKDKVLEK
ncbi:MAG: DUF2231 domain-containing protein [Bacteroidia bacterium]|nr:DUF2231 domain-containing protein [Bacteroidia bacterium]